MANRYYSLRMFIIASTVGHSVHSVAGSYDHFCFFDHICNSTKRKDEFAFFIFFTFKSKSSEFLSSYELWRPSIGWKRLLLSDGPRQTINALTLYSIYLAKKNNGPWYDVPKYFAGNSLSTSALTVSTFFTFVIFAGSLLLLIIAGLCYIPLLCYIQGNLKVSFVVTRTRSWFTSFQEYVCHKVDKVSSHSYSFCL